MLSIDGACCICGCALTDGVGVSFEECVAVGPSACANVDEGVLVDAAELVTDDYSYRSVVFLDNAGVVSYRY